MTAPAIAPATEHEIRTADGRLLRAYATGDPGGALVLVHHGTPCSGILAGWWAADAAARGIQLVGYDRPGYGGSDRHPGRSVADAVADAVTVADAFGAARFRTWGVSGGGPHALACAALRPDRVIAAATLASVAPFDAAGLDWMAGMGQDNVDEFGAALAGEAALRPYLTEAGAQLIAGGATGLAEGMATILPPVDVAVLTGEVCEFMYAWMTGGQRGGVDGWLDDDLAFVRDWGFDPSAIEVPVLLLQGRHDLMVPFAHGEWLARHVRGGHPRLTDNDGHLTLITDVSVVHDWLMRH